MLADPDDLGAQRPGDLDRAVIGSPIDHDDFFHPSRHPLQHPADVGLFVQRRDDHAHRRKIREDRKWIVARSRRLNKDPSATK
jgi:hypothetical protein